MSVSTLSVVADDLQTKRVPYGYIMNSFMHVLMVAAFVPLFALSGCGSPETTEEEAPDSEVAKPSSSPTPEGPQESSSIEELKKQIPDLDNLEVSDLGNHIEISFTGSEFGDSLDQKATLDIVQAVAKYTGKYEYVMVVGNEPAGTWTSSYEHDTVNEIGAIDDPVVPKIWDVADRFVDLR